VILAGVSVVVLVAAFHARPEKNGIFMDQMTYLLQAVSIAHDGDLRYDLQDRARFLTLGWGEQPYGLFLRRSGGVYYYAKPAAYALFAAPLALLSPNRGPVILNAALWIATLLLGFRWLSRSMGPVSAAAISAATWVLSIPVFYVFVIHLDVFLFFLLAAFLHLGLDPCRVRSSPEAPEIRPWRALALGVCGGLMVYSRPLFLPFLISVSALWWMRGTRRMAVAAMAVSVFLAVAMSAYHAVEDGQFSPYQGQRLVVGPADPFSLDPATQSLRPTGTGVYFSPGELWRRLVEKPVGFLLYLPRFFLHFLAGRRGGMFPHMTPFLLLLVGAVAGLARPEGRRALWVLVPAFLYVMVLFRFAPHTWYGGGTAIGSRYAVQIAPAFLYAFGWTRPGRRMVAAILLGSLLVAPYFPGRLLTIPADAIRDNYNIFQWNKYRFLPVEPELLLLNCDKYGAKISVGANTFAFRLSEGLLSPESTTTLTLTRGERCRIGILRLHEEGEPPQVRIRSAEEPVGGVISWDTRARRFDPPASGSRAIVMHAAKPVVMDFGRPPMYYWPVEFKVDGKPEKAGESEPPPPALYVELAQPDGNTTASRVAGSLP
jgi:hypothetical protein